MNFFNSKLFYSDVNVFNVQKETISSKDDVILNKFAESGLVISVIDGIAKVKGLLAVGFGELVEFSSSDVGIVLSIESDTVQIVLFGNDRNILPGDTVIKKSSSLEVYVSFDVLGRVLNSLGAFIDGKGDAADSADEQQSITIESIQKEDFSEDAVNSILTA